MKADELKKITTDALDKLAVIGSFASVEELSRIPTSERGRPNPPGASPLRAHAASSSWSRKTCGRRSSAEEVVD
jgi:hypothetical protein